MSNPGKDMGFVGAPATGGFGYHYQFAGGVKAVGIVEIVFQVLFSIMAFALVCLLLFGSSVLLSMTGSTVTHNPSDTPTPSPEAVSGLMIAGIVIIVLLVIFQGWLVHLVFTGGQTKNSGRLTLWYIIQSVFAGFMVLSILLGLVAVPWYTTVTRVCYMVYRVWSIHVVRCHANEIKEEANGRLSFPNQI